MFFKCINILLDFKLKVLDNEINKLVVVSIYMFIYVGVLEKHKYQISYNCLIHVVKYLSTKISIFSFDNLYHIKEHLWTIRVHNHELNFLLEILLQ